MLTDLLRALAEPRPPSMGALAARMGTDAGGLRRALEQCERLGYLERTDAACEPTSCASCPLAGGCVSAGPVGRASSAACPAPQSGGCHPSAPSGSVVGPVWWRLTDRGARAIHAR